MKVVLATFLLVCFAGCNKESDGKNDDENSTDVDMSKYPAEISEWSGQNFVDILPMPVYSVMTMDMKRGFRITHLIGRTLRSMNVPDGGIKKERIG